MKSQQIVDLTFPIEPHFRWSVDRKMLQKMEEGSAFQVTWLAMPVHCFTHIDTPRHMVPGGSTTDDFRLEHLVGEAKIVDLSGIAPDTAIGADRLAAAAAHVGPGDTVLLKTCWDEDQQSAQVLEAYLNRVHGNWREEAPAAGGRGAEAFGEGPMSRDEAYRILGLDPGAGTEEIKEAYHRLMAGLHPDHGGSTYLAAKINQAKDVLLGK